MIKKTLFIGAICLLLLSCGRKVKTFYDSGELMEKYAINEEGIKKGVYKRYHINGKVAETTTYINDLKEGQRELFNENGGLESKTNYSEGLIDGEHIVYYPSGQILQKSTYSKGKIVGILTKFYESGGKIEEVTFADDMENGPFSEYYENGQLKWKGSYLNGDHEFGLLENFDEGGELLKRMQCDSLGICITIWKAEEE